ncbi:MAG: peptidoglycan binding domain-containing protein, partial [Chloroflexota bacterium]|nr:peptidoglycan binding domain-containing protein [Chloroflexota bacterium]
MSKAEPWSQATQPMRTIRGRAFPGGKRPLGVLLGLIAVLAVLGAGLAYYSSTYNGRIYRGVSVMGVDVSGRTPAEAETALLAHAARYADSPLMLRQADLSWEVTPRELGLALDVQPLVRQAYSEGRDGSLLEQWSHRLPVFGAATDIPGRYVLDRGRIEQYVQGLTADVARKPVDSALSLRPSGELVATQERAGQKLDTDAAVLQIQEVVNQLGRDEVSLPVLVVPPPQTREGWRDAKALGEAVAARPLQLRFGEQAWTLTPTHLRSAIVAAQGEQLVGRFDTARMEKLLAPVAADIKRAPVDASLKIQDGAA